MNNRQQNKQNKHTTVTSDLHLVHFNYFMKINFMKIYLSSYLPRVTRGHNKLHVHKS